VSGCKLDPLFEAGDSRVVVPKDVIGELPECFEETVLGSPRMSSRQLRCYHGYHVREYDSVYEVHRDRFDPRVRPFSHLMFDTSLLRALIALLVAGRLWRRRRR
jgi:hypothetical protein